MLNIIFWLATLYLEYTFTTTAISANAMTKIKIQIFSDNMLLYQVFTSWGRSRT